MEYKWTFSIRSGLLGLIFVEFTIVIICYKKGQWRLSLNMTVEFSISSAAISFLDFLLK